MRRTPNIARIMLLLMLPGILAACSDCKQAIITKSVEIFMPPDTNCVR